jgi:hypothetical protein
MTYEGRDDCGDGCTTIASRARVPVWTWQAVHDRLCDAMRHWWRSHDNDARFSLGGRISSVWRSYVPDRRDLAAWGALVDFEADEPSPLPLSRADIRRMNEASEWMRFVPEGDRRLVVMVLAKMAGGRHKTVPWLTIWKALGRGKPGPDGLRSRYSRAITCVANELNGGIPRR